MNWLVNLTESPGSFRIDKLQLYLLTNICLNISRMIRPNLVTASVPKHSTNWCVASYDYAYVWIHVYVSLNLSNIMRAPFRPKLVTASVPEHSTNWCAASYEYAYIWIHVCMIPRSLPASCTRPSNHWYMPHHQSRVFICTLCCTVPLMSNGNCNVGKLYDLWGTRQRHCKEKGVCRSEQYCCRDGSGRKQEAHQKMRTPFWINMNSINRILPRYYRGCMRSSEGKLSLPQNS